MDYTKLKSDPNRKDGISRRRLLSLSTLTIATVAGCTSQSETGNQSSTTSTPTTTTIKQTEQPSPSVTLDDQTIDGADVRIAEVVTNDAVLFRVHKGSDVFVEGEFKANTHKQDFSLELDKKPLTGGEFWVSLFPINGGKAIAKDSAQVTVESAEITQEGIPMTKVESDPDAGFNHPYFLYVPPTTGEWDEQIPLLVEPTNSGKATDDFSVHLNSARDRINGERGGHPRTICEQLGVPLLIPVFPRPLNEPVDGRYHVHSLDRDTLAISDGPIERVDRQLLRMVEHAQSKLDEEGYPVQDKIILNGYSGSGQFAQRFTVLHPERVQSVSAGGLAGMPLLPIEEAQGHTLDYHIGIADVPQLTGEDVDISSLRSVDQFYYEGGQDTNDTFGHNDTWTSNELEEVALDIFGDWSISERLPYVQEVYDNAGVQSQFRIYEDAGHTIQPAIDDVIEFHRKSMNGDDVSEIGEDLN